MVYIDDMHIPYRNMTMCHMIADTSAELLAMAAAIGLDQRWLQHAGTYKEHFDVSQSKRTLALKHGAVPITWKACAHMLARRKGTLHA